MKNWTWKQLAVLVIGLLCAAVLGCNAMLKEVFPCVIDAESRSYIGEETVRKVTSLANAEVIQKRVRITYRDNLLDLRRAIEDEDNAYADALAIDARVKESQEWMGTVIGSPEEPASIMGILAMTGLSGLIGARYFKRKGDCSPEEVKVAVASAVEEERKRNGNNGSSTEVSTV